MVKRWVANLGLVAASLLISVLAIEGALALLGLGSPYISGPSRLHDDVLLYRLPAHYAPGIDAAGYRNPERPGPYGTVVLGDSHTYGYNAANGESWPRVLEEMTGLRTYNAGMGGFGVAQYRYLAEQMLAKYRPRLLVITLFLGNDLADTCYIADRLTYWHEVYRRRGFDRWHCPRQAEAANDADEPEMARRSLNVWLRSTRLGGILLHRVVKPLKDEIAFRRNEDFATYHLEAGRLRTVVSSHYAHGEPESDAGLRIVRELMTEIVALAGEADAEVAVLLVPSKPSALARLMRERGAELPPAVLHDIEWERKYEAAMIRFLRERGIPFANARPALEAAVAAGGKPVYPLDADDHPNPVGYRIYAQAFVDAMRQYDDISAILGIGRKSARQALRN